MREGAAREHEVRVMGFALAALAVLTAFLATWFASAVGEKLRSQSDDASVTGPGASIVATEHR